MHACISGCLSLQVLHEPLFILAPASQSAAPAEEQAGSALPDASQRTLHCCYAVPSQRGSPAVLVATDECGELLHSQLLAGRPSEHILQVSSCEGIQKATWSEHHSTTAISCHSGAAEKHVGTLPAATEAQAAATCRIVLSAALDIWHVACSSGSVTMRRIVIACLGAMPPAEQQVCLSCATGPLH